MIASDLPSRYELISAVGKGGGGEVLAVRDRLSNRVVALKALHEHGTEQESEALVREATALSGLEGLGVPRVLRFGRLPESRRPYMVRELVEGTSLAQMLDDGADGHRCLEAVARACEQITLLHRANLLHGDVKPANIVVGADDTATLVDLGLAARWTEEGGKVLGLTPKYAAPELFHGHNLDVRSEIYALGATLAEVLERAAKYRTAPDLAALITTANRAKSPIRQDRFPSADELASEIRRHARLAPRDAAGAGAASWPIVAIDEVTDALRIQMESLREGETLLLSGPRGSGKSAVLRRCAWSLGIEGRKVAWVEGGSHDVLEELRTELSEYRPHLRGVAILLDDAHRLDERALQVVQQAREQGAKLLAVSTATQLAPAFGNSTTVPVPPLPERAARELVLRAIPSLSDALVRHLVRVSGGRPGQLRTMVRKLEGKTVVSTGDLERVLDEVKAAPSSQPVVSPLFQTNALLDQGRYDEAAVPLAQLRSDRTLAASIARARLALGRGDAPSALQELGQGLPLVEGESDRELVASYHLYMARAKLRAGAYADVVAHAENVMDSKVTAPLRADATSVLGIAQSYMGDHERALRTIEDALSIARRAGDARVESLVLASKALILQRCERLADAKLAYEEAQGAAESAGDAGSTATIRLNLAAITQAQGDFALALAHLEAAVDLGRRAGRRSTVEQALLNLANLDIYLGRYARARGSIDALAAHHDSLSPASSAQLLGLRADLAARTGEPSAAQDLYEQCAGAYEALGRRVDAAEAVLEAVLWSVRRDDVRADHVATQIARAQNELGDAPAHAALLSLARGSLDRIRGDEDAARVALDRALTQARQAGQKEWEWRTLDARARLSTDCGQTMAARRDIEDAVAVLERIAQRLPRDLREVFWDDARRRKLRAMSHLTISSSGAAVETPSFRKAPSLEDRLTRILEITRDLALEHHLPRLLERVTDHAIALLGAERGFVILVNQGGDLSVHASRDSAGDDPHSGFSRNIAEQVIGSGNAVISLSARDDERMADYVSVHQLMLQSVACVPILSPRAAAIGALYLETRLRPGHQFSEELPTLRAFADQVAIAIENARLVTESARRAQELEQANRELVAARAHLEDALGQRTAQLDATRRDLRSTRAVLRSHFGYQGLVGTSAAMRTVYALIDRIKETDVPVLLLGESGTGKEVVARAIHNAGQRCRGPFIGLNCGAIPEHLLESELFGHVRGAFTGADRDRKGVFRESEGGTILLDEIGEMPKKMQAGLLRVLQERVVRPVGGAKEQAVDVRVIAATNRDLASMVKEGTFREDLYYRLHVVELRLPPLRARADDLPVLIDYFLGIFAARYRREKKTVSREARSKLARYEWPGNVRQLENVLLNAWVMSEKPELEEEDFDLPSTAAAPEPKSSRTVNQHEPPRSRGKATGLKSHKNAERERIIQALESCGWNRLKAAEAVGLPRRTFYRRLREYGIQ